MFDLERVLEGIDAVVPEDVRRIAGKLFGDELSVGFIARHDAAEKLRGVYEVGGPLLASETQAEDSSGRCSDTDATV